MSYPPQRASALPPGSGSGRGPRRLVVLGDSLSQGFRHGAIHRARWSYPAMAAAALGDREFPVPDFDGAGGIPFNLERALHALGDRYGDTVSLGEWPGALALFRRLMDEVEDYWERGPGAEPGLARLHSNLSVWGFEIADSWRVTEGLARGFVANARDQWLRQVPEAAAFQTARRVLNPSFSVAGMRRHALRAATEIARSEGIENLLVNLGGNHALGTVTSLRIRWSEESDLHAGPGERRANLYRPEHFERLALELARRVRAVGAERVFVATVPRVTIPPVSRGTPPASLRNGTFDYYTRPWIWDDRFQPARHPHLTRAQVEEIDATIDAYNQTLHRVAAEGGWFVFDVAGELDRFAFRRQRGHTTGRWPAGLVDALLEDPELAYLVKPDRRVALATRFLRLSPAASPSIAKGGLVGLDGVHPTVVASGLLADALLATMERAGVPDVGRLDWSAIVAHDTLLRQPPRVLGHLRETLAFLDRQGTLSRILACLG